MDLGNEAAGGSRVDAPWRGALLRDHVLAGRIFDVEGGVSVTEAQLVDRVRRARFVLLGERHDNGDHHALQARLVRAAVQPDRRPSVAFEMLDVSKQPAIDAHFARAPGDAFGLGAAVAWETSEWPDWSMYAPIVEAAVDGGARIVAANLPRGDVMAAARTGVVSLGGRDLALPDLPGPQHEAMKREMFDAHCERLPMEMMGAMARAQVARDFTLAHRMIGADRGDGVILITGSGHARKDRGVPWHLERAGVDGPILSVGLLEVREGQDDPLRYGDDGRRPPYDLVWFTPGWQREDPCEQLSPGG